MQLSQRLLTRVAAIAMHVEGSLVETVAYTHKASATGASQASQVRMHLENYRQREIDLELILPNDLRARIQTSLLAFTPTRFDQFVRPDGLEWRVMQVAGGLGTLFWLLQCRQVA